MKKMISQKKMIPQKKTVSEYVEECHKNAVEKGFWDFYLSALCRPMPVELRRRLNQYVTTTLIMLIVTELSEAVEALRKDDMSNFKEELADVAIRLFDLVGGLEIDLEEEINKKMEINKNREKMHNKLF